MKVQDGGCCRNATQEGRFSYRSLLHCFGFFFFFCHGSEKTDYTKALRLNADLKQEEGYRTTPTCLPLNKGVKVVVL